MKKNLMFLAFAALGLASCNSGFKKGNGGLLYDIHTSKNGQKIKEGDFIVLNLVAKTDGDSVLMSTYENGNPITTVLQKSQSSGDILSGVKMLAEGDSATIKTSIDSMYKKGGRKPPFKGKYIVYDIKVEKVFSKGKQSDTAFNNQITAYMKTRVEAMKKAEPVKIKKYIDDNKLKLSTTASGLNYVITKQGTGEMPKVGDTVEVYYVGRFINGKLFDTNVKDAAQKGKTFNPMQQYKPIRVPVGVKAVITGWDEGLQLLNKGAKGTFIIPSNLAYGEQGYQVIPPFSPLVFDVEMVNIIHPDPNAKKPAPMSPLQKMQQQTRK